MKRILCPLLGLALVLLLCACAPRRPTPTDVSMAPTPSLTDAPSESSVQPTESESAEPTDSEPTDSSAAPTGPKEPTEGLTVTYTSAVCYSDGQGGTTTQLLCVVKNTGSEPLVLDAGTFVLSDGRTRQRLTDVAAYPQVLAPGESGYFREYANNLPFVEGASISVTPTLTGHTASTAERAALTRYEIARGTLRDSRYGGLTFDGYVQYTGGSDSWGLYVVCVLLDENDLPVGLLTTLIDCPQSASSVHVNTDDYELPPSLSAHKLGRYEVFAYPILQR